MGEAARKNLRGGSKKGRGVGAGRSNKEREVESLIASAMGPCAGIMCGAGEEAITLDLKRMTVQETEEERGNDLGLVEKISQEEGS